MSTLAFYVAPLLFVLFIVAVLFVTAPDRTEQIRGLKATGPRVGHWFATFPAEIWQRITIKKIIWIFLLAWLGSYIWTYRTIQNKVGEFLEAEDKEGITVGSLVMPYMAFFMSDYEADTGFSKSKKRTRAEVSVEGSVLSDIEVYISKRQMVKVNKIAGTAFSFSYLTDTKILKPEIQRFLKKMVRNRDIHQGRIETFDNRGPYIFAVLAEKDRARDAKTVASAIAEKILTHLTKTKQLKVNQVVVKVVDPVEYTKGRIKVIGRGTAGKY